MAIRKAKVEMSEVRANGEMGENGDNGWLTFVIHAVDDDYDITVRLHRDYFEGCDPGSVFQMVNRKGYGHIMSEEAYSAANKIAAEEKEAFMRDWRNKKRQAIIDGEYVSSTRGGPRGPRLSEFDQELNKVIIELALKPRYKDDKPFPTKLKDLISGHPLSYWLDYVRKSPNWTHLPDIARERIAQRKAEAERELAKVAPANSTAEAFATL